MSVEDLPRYVAMMFMGSDDVATDACSCILELIKTGSVQAVATSRGSLPAIAQVAKNRTGDACKSACTAMFLMAQREELRVVLCETAVILEALCHVVRTHVDEARAIACSALFSLAMTDSCRSPIIETPGLVQALSHAAGTSKGAIAMAACGTLMFLSILERKRSVIAGADGLVEDLLEVLSDRKEQACMAAATSLAMLFGSPDVIAKDATTVCNRLEHLLDVADDIAMWTLIAIANIGRREFLRTFDASNVNRKLIAKFLHATATKTSDSNAVPSTVKPLLFALSNLSANASIRELLIQPKLGQLTTAALKSSAPRLLADTQVRAFAILSVGYAVFGPPESEPVEKESSEVSAVLETIFEGKKVSELLTASTMSSLPPDAQNMAERLLAAST